MTDVIYKTNDNLIKVEGLKNAASGAFINSGATVTVTLVDSAGTEVTGQTWPLTLAYVASSDGDWRGTLVDVLVLIVGAKYTAQITADAGSNLKGYWEFPLKAQLRTK